MFNFGRTRKSAGVNDVPSDPPPYTNTPSAYSILTGPTTQLDLEDRIHATQTPEYLALAKRLRFNKAILWIVFTLLIFATACACFAEFRYRQLLGEPDTCDTKSANRDEAMDKGTNIVAKEMAGERMCITGYTESQMKLEVTLMAEKYGYKEKIWTKACPNTGAFAYPGDIYAEYVFVVLK
jgi:hypothetical protein